MTLIREFVSTVYVVQDNKILMTWNKKVNNWVPIGGHVDPNELPCDSVIREAKEESGLEIELISPFNHAQTANLIQPLHIHLDKIKPDHEHMNLIYIGIVKGGVCRTIDDEGKALRWFTKDELEKENLIPSVKEWAIESLNQLGDK